MAEPTKAGPTTGPRGPGMTTATTATGMTGGAGGARAARISQLGRYRIEKPLGVGGSASVYLAVDETIEKKVALKVLHEHLRDDPVTVRRFANDARALARLNHTNIVQVFAAELDQYYFAMEYVEGVDLARLIADSGSLPPGRAVAIALQMAEALAHIHRTGLVHRDVKPGNVLVAPGERIKMTDFSVVRETEETMLTLKGSLVGTVEYMSPEQIREEEADVRADIYALGAVLYEMLTGRPPFQRDAGVSELWPLMEKILKTPPAPAHEVDPSIPREVSAIVSRALEKDPAARFPSMEAFSEALRKSAGEVETVLVTPVALAEPVESEGQVRLTWTESSAADFDLYEVHASDRSDFVPGAASRVATIRDRAATETALPVPPAGGRRYYRVKVLLRGGLGAVSNRAAIEHGKKPPVWRRRNVQVLAGVALLASFAAAFLNRPAPQAVTLLEGADRVRATGRFTSAQYQQTGSIQFALSNPEIEALETGPIASQLAVLPRPRSSVLKDDVALDAAGMTSPRSSAGRRRRGRLVSEQGATEDLPRPASASGVRFQASKRRASPLAEWKSHENQLVKLSAVVRERGTRDINAGYLELGIQDRKCVVIFRFETPSKPRSHRRGLRARVTVIGRVGNHASAGWQIVLLRPEHLIVE